MKKKQKFKRDKVLELARKGVPPETIRKRLDIAEGYLYSILRENGLLRRDTYFRNKTETAKELYEKYECYHEVSEAMGITYDNAYYHVNKQ